MRLGLVTLGLALLGFGGAVAAAEQRPDPQELFDKAIQLDLGGEGGAAAAFLVFKQAADQGFPAAEFNVAVMLDSGRGVAADRSSAALWYARAAAHGEHRAAFNLGQLYEAGEGVPQNAELAKAWFAYSTLPAALARAARLRQASPRDRALVAPVCADPAPDARLPLKPDGVEFVWTSRVEPEPVRFFIEIRTEAGQEVYAGYATVSSALVPLTGRTGKFNWRVSAVAVSQGRYLACDWSAFTLLAD